MEGRFLDNQSTIVSIHLIAAWKNAEQLAKLRSSYRSAAKADRHDRENLLDVEIAPAATQAVSGRRDCLPSGTLGNITIEQIIAAYQSVLRALVAERIPTHLTSVVAVEDVLQAVWMETDHRLPGVEFESVQQLGAWIKAIARFRLRDALRSAQAYGRGDVRVVGQDRTSATDAIGACCAVQRTPSSTVAGEETDNELLKALQTLSHRDQQIMRLRYFDGLTPKETARTLELPLTTVNSATYRAKREIAVRMGGAGRYYNDP